MILSRTLTQLLILTVAFTLALSINYLYAAVWSGPPLGVPPANNVNAPIHVGTAPQIKDGILEVGHSLNTSANYGLITKGRIRIDVGGIQFSDGSYQEKAATGPRVIQGGALIHAQSATINAGWGTVNITGTSCGPSGTCPMGGVIYKSGTTVKISAFVGDYNTMNNATNGGGYDLTLANGVQSCFKTNAFCVTYTSASDTLLITTAGVLSYVAYAL